MTHHDGLDMALRALADGNRRAILVALRDEPMAGGTVAERLALSQQIASHHLRTLHAAGLVSVERDGTRHLFSINREGFAVVQDYLGDFWPTRLDALKRVAEAAAAAERADG